MPTKIKLRILQAKDLPVMDHTNHTTDAYVEVKLSDFYSEKTEIAHKTLNPKWYSDFVIEVTHDGDILKHPLEIKVWDRDTISSDDIIGGVLIDLSNLLLSDVNEIAGWFPIYDTMRGVRGELKLSVSLSFFGKATGIGADSTDSVLFSFGSVAPPNMIVTQILGFVEELLVDDDPEYDWKDQFRSSRNSNQSRQYLLYKLSAKLRREIGTKVVGLGGNAVLGFKNHVDYESEGSLVIRGFGTAVILKRNRPMASLSSIPLSPTSLATASPVLQSPIQEEEFTAMRSSDTPFDMDDLHSPGAIPSTKYGSTSVLPTGERIPTSITGSDNPQFTVLKMHVGDVQLLTISQFPPPTVVRIAGVAMAHSIKTVPKGSSEEKGRTTRDKWWSELRAEVKSHARFLGCQYVLGYRETTVFYNDIILLTASGTAANLKMLSSSIAGASGPIPHTNGMISNTSSSSVLMNPGSSGNIHGSLGVNPLLEVDETDSNASSVAASPASLGVSLPPMSTSVPIPAASVGGGPGTISSPIVPPLSSTADFVAFGSQGSSSYQGSFMAAYAGRSTTLSASEGPVPPMLPPQTAQWNHNACGICHIPYKVDKAPYKLKLERCGVCGRKTVPEILLATIEPPSGLHVVGPGQLIEAYDARMRKKGDDVATQLGEAIPFFEFDLYKQLMNKLRMLGLNACFKLTMKISVGDSVIVGHMQATGMCLAALPRPEPALRDRSSSAAGSKPASHDVTPRQKALLSQFTKISQESARLRNESSIELYPDNSMPVLWRRHHWLQLQQQSQPTPPAPFHAHAHPHSLEDVPAVSLSAMLNAAAADPTSIHFHLPTETSPHPHPTIGSSVGGGSSLGEFAMSLHDHGEEDDDDGQGVQFISKEILKEQQQPSYLVELESELDEDLLSLIISDPPMPTDFAMCSTQALPGTNSATWHNMQLFTVVRIVEWSIPKGLEKASVQLRKAFASLFHKLYSHLSFRMHLMRPCAITGIKTELRIADNDELQVTVTGMVLHSHATWKLGALSTPSITAGTSSSGASSMTPPNHSALSATPTKSLTSSSKRSGANSEVSSATGGASSAPTASALGDAPDAKKQRKKFKKMGSSEFIDPEESREERDAPKEKEKKKVPASPSSPRKSALADTASHSHASHNHAGEDPAPVSPTVIPANLLTPPVAGTIPHVEITPLNYIPGSVIDKFIGTIHLSFIKESFSLREAGGMNVFTQNLILEAQRVARAHVLALGANVLASYNMELTQKFKVPKNQGYCLLTITGDAMLATPLPLTPQSSTTPSPQGFSSALGMGYRKLAKAQTRIGSVASS